MTIPLNYMSISNSFKAITKNPFLSLVKSPDFTIFSMSRYSQSNLFVKTYSLILSTFGFAKKVAVLSCLIYPFLAFST